MSDIHGYYAALGVSETAASHEIKAAYRALAKEYHPDRGPRRDSGATFRFITEAYSVLSDEDERRKYDALGGPGTSAEGSSTRQGAKPDQPSNIELQHCHVCNKATAQPRYLVFWRVTSFIFGTNRSPIQGIYCANCARSEQTRSTIWTGLLGWWGVPWGPVWCLSNGIQNALGGKRHPEVDDSLMWGNALGFMQRGDVRLAAGAANRLITSSSAEIAYHAQQLLDLLRSSGIDTAVELTNVWKGSWTRTFSLLVAVFLAPALVAGGIYFLSGESETSTYSERGRQVQSTFPSAEPTGGGVESAPVAQSEPPPAPASCASPPANGTILTDHRGSQEEGHILSISNGTQGDAIIKVKDASSGNTIASFFVTEGRSADLPKLPDGIVKIQYAFGTLGADCESFSKIDGASEFPDTTSFETRYVEEYDRTVVERDHLTYTLYAVPGGNVRPSRIDPSEFAHD